MICSVCLENFDSTERRPKVLPCGHSYCLKCLIQLPSKKCPVDSKAFNIQPEKLLDNFSLLEECNRPVGGSAARFWCLSCKRVASEDCVEDHPVCSLKKARSKEAGPLLESIKEGEAALDKLGETLDEVARELENSRDRLDQEKAALAEARIRIRDAQAADDATWEAAKQAAAVDGLSRTAAELMADLADPAARCTLSVRRGEGGGVAWRGEVRTATDGAAKLLLCRLAFRGRLRAEQQQEEEQELQPQQQQRRQGARPAGPRCQELSNDMPTVQEMTVEAMAEYMHVGCKVGRGRDWAGGSADPGIGTVTAVTIGNTSRTLPSTSHTTRSVSVMWDSTGGTGTYHMGYYTLLDSNRRYQLMTAYQLSLLALALPDLLKPHLGKSQSVWDVAATTSSAQRALKLTDGSLKSVRILANLDCSESHHWSHKMLQLVAPHLEGLQMASPQQRHMDVLLTMPYLDSLCLSGVVGDHLQLLNQIPSLQALCIYGVTGDALQVASRIASVNRLELHCPLEAPLPVLDFPATAATLQWLRCGVYPLAAALALVRAHAASLQELQLVAASSKPYGCPDLAEEVRRCALKQLRRMVLLRQTQSGVFCRHDNDSCRLQKLQLWDMFVETNLDVEVICSGCDKEQFQKL